MLPGSSCSFASPLRNLPALLNSGQALQPGDVAALLAELEKTYAMADERAVHQGRAAAPSPQPADEITFF